MPATQTNQPATQSDPQRVLSRFEAGAAYQNGTHRRIGIADSDSSQHHERLLAQVESLMDADRRKDESMALLLHELRSPLASIQNAVGVLRIRGKDEALQLRMHELIERQVRQIALLAADMCQTAGPRAEKAQPQLRRIDLCSVLRRAAETVTPDITERQHQLLIGVPDSNVWVLGDESRLEQVFVNLLANASKYSEDCGRIVLSMESIDGYAVVQVRDSGIGIAAESLPLIFDLFVRADSAAVRTRPGLGIGLALVRLILDSHHGTVVAASEGVGRGSEFTVRLKLEA